MSAASEPTTDLAVLVPDQTFARVIAALLERRQSLGIRSIRARIYVHRYHDPGCLQGSADFLAQFRPTHGRAIVLFDKEGCGQEAASAPELEQRVRTARHRSGWAGRAEAVVLDPELEAWAWSDSPEVARWRAGRARLRLCGSGWSNKECGDRALRSQATRRAR